jgi:hypothetical protein
MVGDCLNCDASQNGNVKDPSIYVLSDDVLLTVRIYRAIFLSFCQLHVVRHTHGIAPRVSTVVQRVHQYIECSLHAPLFPLAQFELFT